MSTDKKITVSHVARSVIENKLLDTLTNGGAVAILASEQDLDDLIRALWNYEGDLERRDRIENLRADFIRLQKAAFPK